MLIAFAIFIPAGCLLYSLLKPPVQQSGQLIPSFKKFHLSNVPLTGQKQHD